MYMRIIENHNPKWTEHHLKHVEKYQKAYGLEISQIDIVKEIQNIDMGHPTKRCSGNMRCFEIYDEHMYIGDITLNKITKDIYEMDIAIFDEYSGQGNAKRAINEFTKVFFLQNTGLSLEAIVRNENPAKEKVQSLLIETGFTFIKELETGKLFSLERKHD